MGIKELNGTSFSRLTEEEKDRVAELLKELINFFKEEFGLTLYPNFGTLLGIVRQQDFIPNDNDVDITYFIEEKTREKVLFKIQEVHKKLEEKGLMRYVKDKWKCNGYDLGQALIRYKGLNFELSCSWDEGDLKMWNYSRDLGKAKDLFPLKEVPLRKVKIKIPNNSEFLLKCLYGDWKTPKKEKAKKYQGFKWTLEETAKCLKS